jgi:purine-binding chemotaxis protein CheW
VSAQRYVTFRVADLVVGIAVERVQEILTERRVTPVPLAHPDVAGLLNLRGRIVTAVDARRRLGVAPPESATASTVVVIHTASESIGLLVDGAGDVVEVDESTEDVPDTIRARFGHLVAGIHRGDRAVLLLLDPDRMLAVAS